MVSLPRRERAILKNKSTIVVVSESLGQVSPPPQEKPVAYPGSYLWREKGSGQGKEVVERVWPGIGEPKRVQSLKGNHRVN